MKKNSNESIKNSSRLLVIVSGILLFLLVIFISYSIFGNGKGTYSSNTYSCSNGTEPIVSGSKAYCCDSGWHINSSGGTIIDSTCIKDNWEYDYINGCSQGSKSFSNSTECNTYANGFTVGKNNVRSIKNNCSSDFLVTIYYEKEVCKKSANDATELESSNYVTIIGNGGTWDNGKYPSLKFSYISGGNGKYWINLPDNPIKSDSTFSGYVEGDPDKCESSVEWDSTATNTENKPWDAKIKRTLYACWDNSSGGSTSDTIKTCTVNSTSNSCSQWWKKNYWCTLKTGTQGSQQYECKCEGTVNSSGSCSIECSNNSSGNQCSKYSAKGYSCTVKSSSSNGAVMSCTCNGTLDDSGNCKTSSDSGSDTPTVVTMTFHSNGGLWSDQGGNPVKTVQCTIESGKSSCAPSSLPSGTVSKSGYDFKGWGTSTSCQSGFTSVTSATASKDTTFYACWKETAGSSDTPASCTYEIKGGTGGTVNTGISGCNGKQSYTGKKSLSELEKCVSNTGKCISNWTVKFNKDGTTDTYSSYISSTENNGKDCDITLTPNWGACSSGGTPGGSSSGTPGGSSDESSGGTTTEAEYSEKINEDRCNKGEWVRVEYCQPTSVSNAKCKLTDGTVVDRNTIMNSRSGCDVLGNAFDKVINDYRCNDVTGKWIYITSCQGISIIGAHCKYSSGTVLLTDLSNGAKCSTDKPSTSNGNSDKTQQDVDKSAPTGTLEVIIAWAIGIIALIVSFYYFRKSKTAKLS